MTIQHSVAVRNAKLNAIETAVGTSPTLELRTGAPPANCAAGDSGTVLATMALPSDWLADAASGSKAKAGVWQDLAGDAVGNAAHYRIKQGATCHEQGTVTATGGGGDMTLDNVNIAVGQAVTITAYALTEGNA